MTLVFQIVVAILIAVAITAVTAVCIVYAAGKTIADEFNHKPKGK